VGFWRLARAQRSDDLLQSGGCLAYLLELNIDRPDRIRSRSRPGTPENVLELLGQDETKAATPEQPGSRLAQIAHRRVETELAWLQSGGEELVQLPAARMRRNPAHDLAQSAAIAPESHRRLSRATLNRAAVT
jgi:hypothetical protein